MEPDPSERQIEVLHEIGHSLGLALNLDQALELIFGALSSSMSLKHASIILKAPETGQWRGPTRELLPSGQSGAGRRTAEFLAGLTLETDQPLVMPLKGEVPLFISQSRARALRKEQISLIGVPIILRGSLVGFLLVDRLFANEVPLQEDLRFLGIVAGLLTQFVGRQGEEAREKPWRPEDAALRLGVPVNSRKFFLVGQSPAILEMQHLLKKVAPGRAPVLLIGESGSGKALMARMIHELSPRARYPFLKISCASLPEDLLAAELFGYEKDAVPGAVKARPGRLEEADGGSVLLEEVGELSLNLQAKLVGFLQEMEIQRLGSSRTRKVDVRLLADNFQELAAAVKAGSFREDLYYFLSHGSVKVPPLRERREDIPLLLNHSLDKVSAENHRRFYLTREALEILQNYDWPGNVRELENLVEHLGSVVEGVEIGVQDLPPYMVPTGKGGATPEQTFLCRLREMEKREILSALERHHWIQSHAATELGLTLRQISHRVKQFGLDKLIKKHRSHYRRV